MAIAIAWPVHLRPSILPPIFAHTLHGNFPLGRQVDNTCNLTETPNRRPVLGYKMLTTRWALRRQATRATGKEKLICEYFRDRPEKALCTLYDDPYKLSCWYVSLQIAGTVYLRQNGQKGGREEGKERGKVGDKEGRNRITMPSWATSYHILPRDALELVEKLRIITGLLASKSGMLPSHPEEKGVCRVQ